MIVTIETPEGLLLANQCGQFFYRDQGQLVSVPPTKSRWGLADMAALWADMCQATGQQYVLSIRGHAHP